MKWSLSEFLNELELRGQTWCVVECDVWGGFSTPSDDRLRFYAVLEGTVRIAGATTEPICLRAGDVAIILSGEAHAVRVRPNSRPPILEFMRDGSDQDVPPTITLGGGAAVSRIVEPRYYGDPMIGKVSGANPAQGGQSWSGGDLHVRLRSVYRRTHRTSVACSRLT